jgi:hypothetical protein
MYFVHSFIKDKVFSTPVPDITSLNNWRHVGEHVKRNCLSRSTYCSVLIVVNKLLQLHFEKIYIYIYLYFTYSSFLVINVRNQGKSLCSLCICQLPGNILFLPNFPWMNLFVSCFFTIKFTCLFLKGFPPNPTPPPPRDLKFKPFPSYIPRFDLSGVSIPRKVLFWQWFIT